MLSATFLQQSAQRVGQVAVEKATRWQLTGTDPAPAVTIVATGLDGTTLPLVGEDYKEAMCGTIALYDKAGQRLTPAYLGTLPEAGKATCTRLFTCRVSAVLERYPKALHVVLADGASWNWQLLEAQYPAAVQDAKAAVYVRKVQDDKGTLHLTRVLRSELLMVEAKYYPALRAFFQNVRTGDEEQIIVQPMAARAAN